MTIRATPEGDTDPMDLRCMALEVIHDEIQSPDFPKNIEGVKATQFMYDDRGSEQNCEVGASVGPKRMPGPSVNDSDGPIPVPSDNGTPSGRRISSVVIGAAAGVFVLTLGLLCARRRSGRSSLHEDGGTIESGKLYNIQTLSTDPSGSVLSSSHSEDNGTLHMPLSPRLLHDADSDDEMNFNDVELDSPGRVNV